MRGMGPRGLPIQVGLPGHWEVGISDFPGEKELILPPSTPRPLLLIIVVCRLNIHSMKVCMYMQA